MPFWLSRAAADVRSYCDGLSNEVPEPLGQAGSEGDLGCGPQELGPTGAP